MLDEIKMMSHLSHENVIRCISSSIQLVIPSSTSPIHGVVNMEFDFVHASEKCIFFLTDFLEFVQMKAECIFSARYLFSFFFAISPPLINQLNFISFPASFRPHGTSVSFDSDTLVLEWCVRFSFGKITLNLMFPSSSSMEETLKAFYWNIQFIWTGQHDCISHEILQKGCDTFTKMVLFTEI